MSQDPELAAEKRSDKWLWTAIATVVVSTVADVLNAPWWVMAPFVAGAFFAVVRSYRWHGFAAGLRAANERPGVTTPHRYLSTACWHAKHDPRPGLHGYCQTNATRYDGTEKVAAQCKHCPVPCICECHEGTTDE